MTDPQLALATVATELQKRAPGLRVEIFSEIADAERWLDALGGPPVSLGLRD